MISITKCDLNHDFDTNAGPYIMSTELSCDITDLTEIIISTDRVTANGQPD